MLKRIIMKSFLKKMLLRVRDDEDPSVYVWLPAACRSADEYGLKRLEDGKLCKRSYPNRPLTQRGQTGRKRMLKSVSKEEKGKRKKQKESNAAVEAELTLSIHAAQHRRGDHTLADTIHDGQGVKKSCDQLINNSRRSVNYSPPRLFIVLPNIANKVQKGFFFFLFAFDFP